MKILVTAALLLPVVCWGDQWNKHFDVSGTPELHVVSGNVALTIQAGSDRGIDVEMKTEGISIGTDGARIEPRQEGNRLELRIELAEQHFNWGNHSVKVIVHVPQHIHAFVDSRNGPVDLLDLYGDAHVNTRNGPVVIKRFDGTLETETGNGPVTVAGRFDGLQVHTGNGPVQMTVNPGSKLTTKWNVDTGNGPVHVRLPLTVKADLSLHTGRGPVSFNLPVEKQVSNGHEIHAKLNGGGPELNITTGHGPVSISEL